MTWMQGVVSHRLGMLHQVFTYVILRISKKNVEILLLFFSCILISIHTTKIRLA